MSDRQQVFSNTSLPDYNDLAMKEVQIASNQNDACPHHLAMLVTSYCCHQAYGKRTHVINSTPTIESHFKTKYMVKT